MSRYIWGHVAKFIFDIQGRFSYTPYPKKEVLIKYQLKKTNKVNVIGLANAKEALYTGRYYDMERAKEMGMVNYVVPKETLRAFTDSLAKEIASNAPLSLKGHKHIFSKLFHYPGLREEDRPEIESRIMEAFNSEDLKGGAIAFFQKRKPVFKGR